MKKRTLSVLIILALLVSNLAAPTYLAEASSIVKVAYDPFLVKLEADQKTVIPDDGDNAFGTEAAAGRIWTDKSVEATVDGKFNVELSALAQEYIIQGSGTNGSGGYASSKAPMVDVTFILDMSGSMGITQNGKLLGNDINHETDGIIYRVDAMQRAVNHVIKTVMEANPKNRVAVHWFTGTGNAGTLMPLNSYTTEDANKRYIDYSVSSSNIHTLKNVDSLKITGSNSVVKFSKDVGGGTPTQDGIMYGVQQMITDIGTGQKAIDAPTRTPFVLVLSDGAASSGKDGWYVPASSGSASGNAVSGSAKITAVTILTGRYMKDQLDSKYQHYNNNDTTIKSQFYTVGLGSEQDIYGVSDGGVRDYSAYPWATLDPKDLYARRNDTQGSAKSIHNAIVSYATAQSKPANIKDYSNDYGYSDYYTFADTYTKLIGAFDQLANDAASASKIPPILNLPLGQASGEDTITDHITRAINMTDEIGEGFQIEVNTLKIGNSVAKVEETISNGVVYGFDGYQSKVAIQTVDGVTTLKWFIQADDLKNHIYTFKDRDIPKPGEYNAPKDGPFKLNYRLIPSIEETPDSITKTTYFSNAMDGAEAKTTAYFTPPSDNPYYMNFEETTISKTNGLAGTANYISKETISDGKVSIKLGNNGRLDVEMGVVKSGPEQVKVSDTIKYPVTVYNYTDSDKTVSIQSEGQNRTDISVPGKSSSTEEFTTTAPNTTTEKLTSNVATVDVDGKTITSNTVDTKVVNKINYTVIFDSQGGSAVADVSVLEGTTVLKPVDPAYNDRNFLGWYKEVAYTTAWDFQTDIVTENITLYAKWNNTPTVSNYTATAEYNASVSGIVEGTDIDGDSLTYSKGSDPSNGTVTVNADGTWTYMPNTNYVGSDSFTVTVTDEHGATTISTVNVTVKPNTPPIVVNYDVSTGYNTPVGGTVVGTDSDKDILSYTKASDPSNGTVTVNAEGTWTYTPNTNYVGSDSFTVTVTDEHGATTVSTVNVTVNAEPNTSPTVGTNSVTTEYNIPVGGTVVGTDADGDTLSYTKGSEPANGTVTVNADGTWTYTPNAGYSGSDSFTVTVSDGRGGIAVSTVTVTVKPNIAPTVGNYTATAEHNASVSGTVVGSDIDGDSLTYSKGSDPSNGTVTVNTDGTWTYTPNTNYVGSDSFTVTVTDEHGATTVSTVNVTVNAKPNTSPTVGIDSVTTEYNTPVGGTVVGTDADGDALSYTKGSGPANGTVTVNTDGTWTYTPKAGFTGSDSFTVTVSDGRGGTAVSTVNVTVNAQVIPPVEPPVNTPPTVGNYTVTTGYNTPATGTVAGTDANGDALSYTKASNPTNGTVTVNADGTWTYTPNTDYSGSDSFTVTVSDGRGGTAVSTIKVTVEAKLPAYAINMNANPNSIIGDGKSTTVLTVTIVDSNNKPQENVKVEFSAPIGSFSNGNSAFTDSNGKASVIFKSDKIEGINTQVVPVKATAQDEIRKLHAQGQIEITFEPGSIRGTVVDNETGHPIKGAKVVVKKDFDGDGTIDFLSEMVTGSDGKYNIAVPKGDLVYDVFITAPMMVNGNLEDKTFLQKSEAGNITGKLFEQFDSLKTAAGLVLLKNTDGSIGYLKDYSKITVEVQMNNSGAGYHSDVSNENTSAGVFNIGDLEKDKKYTIDVIYNFDNGQKIIIGKMNAVLDSDGQINISQVLIDPYGIVTDKSTGEIIEGADIKLYYADTARNAANGNKAGELVNLPILEGFPPADNRNPQVSDAEGNYAYMVFPHADYYLVATKPGYETFISETIEVYEEIVRFDIGMMADKKSASTGSETDSKPVTKLPKTGFMLGIEIYELLLVFFVITFIVLISSRFSRKRKI